MTLETARRFLLGCALINYGVLILWCVLFIFAHDSIEKLNTLVMRRKIEHFETIHYAGIALYKLGIILFILIPWIVLTTIKA